MISFWSDWVRGKSRVDTHEVEGSGETLAEEQSLGVLSLVLHFRHDGQAGGKKKSSLDISQATSLCLLQDNSLGGGSSKGETKLADGTHGSGKRGVVGDSHVLVKESSLRRSCGSVRDGHSDSDEEH